MFNRGSVLVSKNQLLMACSSELTGQLIDKYLDFCMKV